MRVLAKVQGTGTPEQLAKAAMKQAALTELKDNGFDNQAEVTIQYMGISHTLYGKPTVNVKNGQIMFHFGVAGANRLPFGIEVENETGKSVTHELSFGVGGNIMTGLEIDDWRTIADKYGLSTNVNEDLDAGETT